ncbi:hypothetical protein E2986_00849 [Frieseomelitta varia]|uniref:Coiled-coil domain-containing protein 112 n=1 Tax=Frieseomelitta varia TaxID=561572 RepID=A0A833W0E4_9HYME|nr:hypothetical protein E2986_00849 [Frieseomelitta varia]
MSASSGNSVKARSDTSRKRSTSAQKDLYMKPLLRLKQQEGILEKGLVTAIENMKIDANLVQDIMNQHRELSLERLVEDCRLIVNMNFCIRRNFLDAMHKNIEDIASELDSAKHIANNPEDLQKLGDVIDIYDFFNINTYKTKLIKLSRKLLDFERSCPIQTLTEEGDALSSELHELHFDLNKYEKAQENATLLSLSCKSKVDNKREKSEYKGADDFHDLVAVTGHTENWPMEDHLFFLKMRKTCENIPTLVAAIQKKFPDLSVETIVNHEAWYKQYADLREKQKAAVKEWRQRKVEKKKNMDEMDRKIEDHCEDEDCLNEVPEEEAIDTFKKTRPPARESRSTNSSASSSESQKKELIKKWRMEKENKRFMDEEQIKMQTRLRKEVEESKRKKRREKIQVALDEYKKKKCLENVLKEMEERSSKERRVYDTTLIKAFR